MLVLVDFVFQFVGVFDLEVEYVQFIVVFELVEYVVVDYLGGDGVGCWLECVIYWLYCNIGLVLGVIKVVFFYCFVCCNIVFCFRLNIFIEKYNFWKRMFIMICFEIMFFSFGLLLCQVCDGLVCQLDMLMVEENFGIGFIYYLGLKVFLVCVLCIVNELVQVLDQVFSVVIWLLDKFEVMGCVWCELYVQDCWVLQIVLIDEGCQLWVWLKQCGDQMMNDVMCDLFQDECVQLYFFMICVCDFFNLL